MKLIVFDMDGTLTPSRSPIDPEMRAALESLAVPYAVISGARESQIRKQVPIESMIALGQNGNEYFGKVLSTFDKHRIFNHILELYEFFRSAESMHDLVEDRGSQISYSLIGHNADREKKQKYDPDGETRRWLLDRRPLKQPDLVALIGGTTCLDYTRVGWDKAANITEYAKSIGASLEEVVYFGDQFYEGGNDAMVHGVCECVEVRDWRDTLERIKDIH